MVLVKPPQRAPAPADEGRTSAARLKRNLTPTVAARPLRQLRHCLTKNRLTDFFLITLYFNFIFVLFVEGNVCTIFFSLKLQKKLCLAYNCTS